jgi:hypothetical protein
MQRNALALLVNRRLSQTNARHESQVIHARLGLPKDEVANDVWLG